MDQGLKVGPGPLYHETPPWAPLHRAPEPPHGDGAPQGALHWRSHAPGGIWGSPAAGRVEGADTWEEAGWGGWQEPAPVIIKK